MSIYVSPILFGLMIQSVLILPSIQCAIFVVGFSRSLGNRTSYAFLPSAGGINMCQYSVFIISTSLPRIVERLLRAHT
jgi:hypothetical protein